MQNIEIEETTWQRDQLLEPKRDSENHLLLWSLQKDCRPPISDKVWPRWGLRNAQVAWLIFFLICRRARRQRSQSPVLGTSIIYKYFELYKKLKTKRKTKEFPISLSSDGAYEQFPFDSPISKKERGKLYNPATQERPSHMIVRTCKWRVSIELRQICTCRRALNCKQPQ